MSEPHHMLLNERTRALLSRKMQRAKLSKQELDHQIDLKPVVGAGENGYQEARATQHRDQTIRHSGDPLTRKLRQRLSPKPQDEISSKKKDEPAPPPSSVIQAGDSVARRARLKRKKKEPD